MSQCNYVILYKMYETSVFSGTGIGELGEK